MLESRAEPHWRALQHELVGTLQLVWRAVSRPALPNV